ncbi:pentapeptide repeat-containing protein [Pseudosulfitobacter pseudonitzschiae]|uniref:pentapeptide repeat-containing protein n=1 Tax=Pseudosulfitobacter pseudonitzschiae TaxID=1402135 RepID=UPI001CCA4036|nr:pentapeptide repeat-containing protein [Pseudosulfitobacter pseudonitzschiae]MCA0138593.1 pentapeptide repeat-containing protein [Pseudosulfitobacter pseudonitzschiae]MCD2330323.1 pentapeptide repeat-containing protein [Pseudosulfitobacter pseudonitzschiae]MCD2354600.1 pentapeptide repeat-containing protein [Pseudosulfitobacter pseudonitzschiae]MCI2216426.1 pentapeptide repeat-containing protein [Pseudosulfitobacter pseudonitzschiae]UFE28387.1 pentapeptide repeat-containing protein [Pseudos
MRNAGSGFSTLKVVVVPSMRAGFLGALALIFVGPANGQDADDEARLRMLGECRGCTFEGLNLAGKTLTGIDLSESTITDVNFSEARLNIALFDYATLKNVSFESADLTGASFSGTRFINVSFDNAQLKAAVFEDAILVDTDLMTGVFCNTQAPDERMINSECD